VLTTRLEQNLRGARVVKAFAQEEAEIERFDRENERWFASLTPPPAGVNCPAARPDRQPGHGDHHLVRRGW
jgi:ABC-type multidrug transport system fused ATPase/permease subunit